MSQFEALWKRIWTDPDFQALSRDGSLLYIWAFSNLRSNMAGLYPCSRQDMVESKVQARYLDAALRELRESKFLFYERNVVWVRGKIRRLPTKGPKIAARIAKDVAEIDPGHPLRVALLYHYGVDRVEEFDWLAPYLTPLNVTRKGEEGSPENDSSDESSPVGDDSVGLGWVNRSSCSKRTAPSQEQKDRDAFERLAADLRPFVTPVLDRLTRVAEAKTSARAPTRAAVCGALASHPHKDFVPAADDCEHYWVHGKGQPRPLTDPVAAYRNWLSRQPDVLRKTEPGGRVVELSRRDELIRAKVARDRERAEALLPDGDGAA